MSKYFSEFNSKFTVIEIKIQYNSAIKPELLNSLKHLKNCLTTISIFAPAFNYKDVDGNGYTAYAHLCVTFADLILVNLSKGKISTVNTELVNIAKTLVILADFLIEIYKRTIQDSGPDVPYYTKTTEIFVRMLDEFNGPLGDQISSVFANSAFWLCPSMRRAMRGFSTLMAIYATNSKKNSIKCIWNSQLRGKILAEISHNANVYFIKSFWSLAEYSVIRDSVPAFFSRQQTAIYKDIYVKHRQTKYVLPVHGDQVEKRSDGQCCENSIDTPQASPVKCRLLHDPSKIAETESLILHCHGGGYVSQSPNSHEVYLRDWLKQMPNVAIISVDYILSPEGKFPQALQQILDIYLWLVSEEHSDDVVQTIGFVPKNLILVGDSAGGNIISATILVLNDIRLRHHDAIKMPIAVFCVYAPLMLNPLSCSSKILTAFDNLLPLGFLLSCLEAYLDFDDNHNSCQSSPIVDMVGGSKCPVIDNNATNIKPDDDENEENDLFRYSHLHFLAEKSDQSPTTADVSEEDFVMINTDDIPPCDSGNIELPDDFSFKIQQNYFTTINSIKKSIYGSTSSAKSSRSNSLSLPISLLNPDHKPWYRSNGDELRCKMRQLIAKCSSPYISPLMYKDFDSLRDIPLYLIAAEFDVFLDDSLALAKKWKGNVVLDLCENLPHGFLNFLSFSEEAKAGSDLCVKRIKDAIHANQMLKMISL